MITVNIHEAKSQFSKLLYRVESGEEVIIEKAGKAVARIVPLAEKPKRRMPGAGKGKIVISKGFFEPLPEYILKEFEQ